MDSTDNCRTVVNPEQEDLDQDGIGDTCDDDQDGDFVPADDDCDDRDPDVAHLSQDTDCDGFPNLGILAEGMFVTGYQHTCVQLNDFSLTCWGQNNYLQTVVPTDIDSQPYRDWYFLSAGYTHMCGLHFDGTMSCWGANYDGRSDVPVQENGEPFNDWVQVSAGYSFTCGLHETGEIQCWGANWDGQLNVLSTTITPPSPTGLT